MTIDKILLTGLLLMVSGHLSAQVSATGYVTLMPSYYSLQESGENYWDNLLHNRINIRDDFTPSFSAVLQLRNRLLGGETVSQIPGYQTLLDRDAGWMDLSTNIVTGSSAVLNTTIDRVWLDFIKGPLQVRMGRQRINWGQTMVWNPNDLFNAYSFFDFDYPERPGIDGVRIQYFSGTTSLTEAVFKIDSHQQKTIALRHRLNKWGYDWQFLTGRLNDSNWVAGLGWSGHVSDAGFYGEVTTLFPESKQENLLLISSVGADYTFPNALLISTEILYSSNKPVEARNFASLLTQNSSVKELSIARYSLFSSIQYPFTPLFTGTLSGMIFPGSTGWYLGPTMEYSLNNNLFLALFVNLFSTNPTDEPATTYRQGALRLKWHF